MGDIKGQELAQLATLLAERNLVDGRIAQLIDRPVERGHIGEWIAARMFDIDLHPSAVHASSDGVFRDGPLAGKTVNVKFYGKREGLLDLSVGVDWYLVLTGPPSATASSRGTTREYRIDHVYLFDAMALHLDLESRGVNVSRVAASVRRVLWDAAEVFPTPRSPWLRLSEEQLGLLQLFAAISSTGRS
jgi:hypothetical protein